MLAKIKTFFNDQLTLDESGNREQQLQLAAAALLVEISCADYTRDSAELKAIESALSHRFDLSREQLDELISLAEAEQADATSLHQFTSLIREQYSNEERFDLVKMLWQVAFADGELSKYEDHMIRKIADLIYLPHSQFIQAKLSAQEEI